MNIHLGDIAKQVGVSKMTVSRALRDDPAVAEGTRRKIQAAAAAMGYMPNPQLARMMSEMAATRRKPTTLGELAFLTTEDTEFGWKQYNHQLSCYTGAEEEAKAYGYTLLPVWALSRRFSRPGSLTEFLWSRGVDGIILQPLGREMIGKAIDIDWGRFCSVEIGATLAEPKLNLVRHNHYEGMLRTLGEMEALGYRRIGLCFTRDSDLRSYHRWASAYLYWRKTRGFDEATLPIFHYTQGNLDRRGLKSWMEAYRIDGMVGMETEPMEACAELGVKIPERLGYAVLDHPGHGSALAGVDQVAVKIGSMAVDILVMAVRKGARGVPRHPVQSIIEGDWIPGTTLRPLGDAGKSLTPVGFERGRGGQ